MFYCIRLALQILAVINIVTGIDIRKCPPLRLPANGYVVCDHLIGAFCAPVCNPGFVHESQPAQAYVCNPLRKAWATYPGGYPLPWPNCVRASTRANIPKAATATKKSIVDQQNAAASESQPGEGKESLWQRMLKLTSQLTQSKMKGVAVGAARSMQASNAASDGNVFEQQGGIKSQIDPGVGQNNNNNYYDNSANGGQYLSYQQNKDELGDLTGKQVEYRRLQQYWDTYYKRYYESLGLKKMPEWMARSPWSNDPESVQGALDSDSMGKGDVPGNNTVYQNWNSYLQSYFAYPAPPNYNETGMTNSTTSPTNSTSESLIENVIENDLYANGFTDKTLNHDLFLEDQLIHNEEKKRPHLNATRLPTTRVRTTLATTTVATTAGPRTTSSTTTRPLSTAGDSKTTTSSRLNAKSSDYYTTTHYPYSSSNYIRHNSDSASSTPYNETVQRTNDASVANNYSATYQDSLSTAGSVKHNTSDDPYTSYINSYKQYMDKLQNNTYPEGSKSVSNSGATSLYAAAAGSAGAPGTNAYSGNATIKAGKSKKKIPGDVSNTSNSSTSQDTSTPVTNDYTVPTGDEVDEDEDNDDLERLDISTLVRELIKLENIRKRKQVLRRKKIQRENSKAVANLLVGDMFRGYFKTKRPLSQKGLKKHLLHKARRLFKKKENQSPLPKFS